ncbi:sortase [Streptomyces sp. 604F]|uniref:class F sortase n=1 Tax=Streptomyces sp. 604F TaxID=1476754 RepID=UPI0013971A1D|nr:class F sortase [Streptomyces sp. 604F]MBP3077514.1 sortase [Streptomyces sp. 604F]QHV87326.1 class F sortase [Streptomyces sp. 604F]WDV31479.1 class F sortase [Streptomyces sp. AD16]
MAEGKRAHGRLISGAAWAVLLLGLWIWGREVSDGSPLPGSGSGRPAAVGGAGGADLPPARDPLPGSRPVRVDVPSIGVSSAEVVSRGLDDAGAVEPPSFDTPDTVGWYDSGPQPGEEGAALLVGHVDTRTRPAVFYTLSATEPGARVRVAREDGTVAEFTVEDVQVLEREGFDAQKAYAPRKQGRAELRLITCGGTFDKARNTYTANVVVSAYLTGTAAPEGAEAENAAEDRTARAARAETAGAGPLTEAAVPPPAGLRRAGSGEALLPSMAMAP